MNLSINDSFETKDEILSAMKDFAESNSIKYDIIETPRTIVLCCKGKGEFGCDCSITASYRKKDNKYIIKRMKLAHKCPISVNDFGSTDDFIKNEIYRTIGDAEVRIGDIVSILHNRGIKVSYNSVWNAMRKNWIEDENVENNENMNNKQDESDSEDKQIKRMKVDGVIKDMYRPKDDSKYNSDLVDGKDLMMWDDQSFCKFHDFNEIIAEYSKEFVEINAEKVEVHFYGKMFFYSVPEYSKVLFPAVEIKHYKKKNGIVVYGLLYDPVFDPVVYACLVAEDVIDVVAFRYFLRSLPNTFFLVEYDEMLIEVLEECGVDFFIKTREVCNHVYSIDNKKENIEAVWNNCNFGENKIPEMGEIDPKRYLKKLLKREILNLNNLPECDVDFVMYSVYSLNFFDCVNAIHKLSNDSLKARKKFTTTDTKSMFGNNVVSRVERNKNTQPTTMYNVDLIKYICECGKFQELMIPCVHACAEIKEKNEDPYKYVSTLYSKEQYNKLPEIIPVLNISIKLHSDKVQIRKGPGRPKKHANREVEIIVN
ncbi:hypothetical protein NGRA_1072 [Nosema granulosis]|uniref:SWIM-type domain-containing protein n=1 Tax=Nosema granulosis TaxID=83296 RepID=A0A9P6GZ71_9MICR|nr:hypothetical protein NGRA_1072 [Nosema granulosis]